MKELSIEEKARRFDKALVIAKSRYSIETEESVRICLELMFPELKESGDERIRKAIKLMYSFLPNNPEYIGGVPVKEIFDWLERQGDQKPAYTKEYDFHGIKFIPKFAKGDIIKDKKRGEVSTIKDFSYDTGLYTYTYGQFPITIQDNYEVIEQKPADKVEQKGMNIVEEDMTPFQKKVFCIIDTTIEEEQGLKQVCDELLRLAHDEIMQKPAWSEEDESILFRIINDLKFLRDTISIDPRYAVNTIGIEREINWLKSFKDKVQPKQKWSEEDESLCRQIDGILSVCRAKSLLSFDLYKKMQDWLKSLKDRYTWKPSEEMIEALGRTIPKNTMEISEDEILLSKLYQGLKYGRVLSKK